MFLDMASSWLLLWDDGISDPIQIQKSLNSSLDLTDLGTTKANYCPSLNDTMCPWVRNGTLAPKTLDKELSL